MLLVYKTFYTITKSPREHLNGSVLEPFLWNIMYVGLLKIKLSSTAQIITEHQEEIQQIFIDTWC